MTNLACHNHKHEQNPTNANKRCNYSFSNIRRIFKSSRLIIFLTDNQKQTEPFVHTSLRGLSLMSTAETEDGRASAELKRWNGGPMESMMMMMMMGYYGNTWVAIVCWCWLQMYLRMWIRRSSKRAGKNENGSLVDQDFAGQIFRTFCRAGEFRPSHLQWKFHLFILQLEH